MNTSIRLLFTLLITCQVSFCLAFVRPNSLFSDHMVLQRGVVVPVWGTAAEGEEVTVQFNGQKVSAKTVNGKWMVKLNALQAGGPFTMSISGDNIITLNDILVGEVWICSGQSNMARKLGLWRGQKPIVNWEQERDAANYPQIRQFYVSQAYSTEAVQDARSKWEVCSPVSVLNFSAVGYFFSKKLHLRLNVPVGILFTAYGGTPAENWTSRSILENNPEFSAIISNYTKRLNDYPGLLKTYQRDEANLLSQFLKDSLSAVKEGKTPPRRPAAPQNPAVINYPGGLYNAMLLPLQPYAIKGFTWYQGENNNDRPKEYQQLLPAMIDNWRSDWGNKELPFLIVQIAPFRTMTPEIREAQLLTVQKTKNTALIVTTDCGDSADIHPAFKQPVGERLALAAYALAYKEKIEYSGPVYQSMKVKDNKATISFTHTGKGLRSKGVELKGFMIAGTDKKFVPATAAIKGDKVIVYSADVITPIAVRYGWSNVPDVNLYNVEGLPASPFRTDGE